MFGVFFLAPGAKVQLGEHSEFFKHLLNFIEIRHSKFSFQQFKDLFALCVFTVLC
jgi:hypothetical protein